MNPIKLTDSTDPINWDARNYPISKVIWEQISREKRFLWAGFGHMYSISYITFDRGIGA